MQTVSNSTVRIPPAFPLNTYNFSESDSLALSYLVNTGIVSVHQALRQGQDNTEKKEPKMIAQDMLEAGLWEVNHQGMLLVNADDFF